MGFIDYAWATSLQKDNTKVKILQDPEIRQPMLLGDDYGFTIKLPCVQTLDSGKFSFLGYTFDENNSGKIKMGRLFRAAVMHLTTHTLAPFSKDRIVPNSSDSIVDAYTKSLINDTYLNAYIQAWYPDRFFDIAYANAFAYQKIKAASRIFTTSTKLMTALLTKLNLGAIKDSPGAEEEKALDQIFNDLNALKETFLGTIAGERSILTRCSTKK